MDPQERFQTGSQVWFWNNIMVRENPVKINSKVISLDSRFFYFYFYWNKKNIHLCILLRKYDPKDMAYRHQDRRVQALVLVVVQGVVLYYYGHRLQWLHQMGHY